MPVRFKQLWTRNSIRRQDGLRRQQARFDRWPDAFAALRIRETGRIADQQNAVIRDISPRIRMQKVGMPPEGRRQVKANLSRAFQKILKFSNVLGEFMDIQAPQADIEKCVFSDAPSVALHVGAKVKLGNLGADRALGELAIRHLEFNFLRGNGDLAARVDTRRARYRTEMPAGADHEAGLELAVRDPLIAGAHQAGHGNALVDARAAALEQKIVKLAAADPITDGPAIIDFHFAAAEAADAKSVDLLQNPATGILARINFEFLQYGRGNPSAANLV